MSWIDDGMDSKYGFIFFLGTIVAALMVFLIALVAIGYYVPKRQSTGVVVMRVQTADKYANPEFYLYIKDDSTGVTIEEEVGGGTYAACKEGRKLNYELYDESNIHKLKIRY